VSFLNEFSKALACGFFVSKKCREIEELVLKQLKNELCARLEGGISYSWLGGESSRSNFNFLRNSLFSIKPIALSLTNHPILSMRTGSSSILISEFKIR